MGTSFSSIPVVKGLPDFYKTWSRKVFQIMEAVGANVEMRQHRIDTSVTYEIARLLITSERAYIFGSTYEGTTTCQMSPDADQVIIFNDLQVVSSLDDHPSGTCLLLVQDQTTQSGYCKLQLVENGRPIWGNDTAVTDRLSSEYFRFCPDKNNRLVCTFQPNNGFIKKFNGRHGPALVLPLADIVWAFKCKSWPECASEWLIRQRHFSWPSTQMINLCSTLGCLFVPVGHPDSDEQSKLWRVSLSHQERSLVTNFNSVQLKCYILLKIINKELIVPYIPDSLSSYHLKTCMFYQIENTSPELWRPENILACIDVCLKLLSHWCETGYCPNYFIPAENMFDRPVHGVVRQKLHQRLQYLISSEYRCLTYIRTNNIGAHLQRLCIPSVDEAITARYLRNMEACQKTSKLSVQNQQLFNIFRFMKQLIVQVHFLGPLNKNNIHIPGYTQEQTQTVFELILPYRELSVMCSQMSWAIQQGKQREQIWSHLTSEKWHKLSLESDSFSSKLKQATYMYILGYYYQSLDILTSLKGVDRLTLCGCYPCSFEYPDLNGLLSVAEGLVITIKDLLKNYIVPCVYFLPTVKVVIPTPLSYEMIQTAGQFPLFKVIENSSEDRCFREWASVDPHFLLYFLLYLNHFQLSMDFHACEDIAKMEFLLNTQDVCHRETCLNLLGWIYKEKGDTDRAKECWRKSLEVKPKCNAAFWHMRDI